MRPFTQRAAPFFAPFALGLALACQSARHVPPGIENEGLVPRRLDRVNPLDVVVLPVENQTGREGLPLDTMRRAFQEGLVKLRYSPLALEYVDRRVVEATYDPGELQEEAVLQVFLTGWDSSQWRTHSRLTVEADVYLLDAKNPSLGQALWGGHVVRVVDMGRERPITATEEALLRRAAERFVEGVLDSLPPRDPRRAPEAGAS